MYQLSTHYSVEQSSSLFTVSVPEITESQEYVTINLRNEAQESFIRQSLSEPTFLIRKVRYNKETGNTENLSDWLEVQRDAFKFIGLDGKEVQAFSTESVLSRFLVKKTKK